MRGCQPGLLKTLGASPELVIPRGPSTCPLLPLACPAGNPCRQEDEGCYRFEHSGCSHSPVISQYSETTLRAANLAASSWAKHCQPQHKGKMPTRSRGRTEPSLAQRIAMQQHPWNQLAQASCPTALKIHKPSQKCEHKPQPLRCVIPQPAKNRAAMPRPELSPNQACLR